MMRRTLVLALPGIVGLAPAHAGSLSILTQDRRVGTDVLVVSGMDTDFASESRIAPDLGPFDASVLSVASLPAITATVLVTQVSQIGASAVDAEGTATATTVGQGAAAATGGSDVTITFSVAQETSYSVQGFAEGFDGANTQVRLMQSSVPIFSFLGANGRVDLDQQGVLAAGEYDYVIHARVDGYAPIFPDTTFTMTTGYDVQFVLAGATAAPVTAAVPAVQAFPNPFRRSTQLVVPEGVREVRIVDAAGRLVRTLSADGRAVFDGRDEAGSPLPGGVYWATAPGAAGTRSVKIVRLR